jgi:hypothetical protein
MRPAALTRPHPRPIRRVEEEIAHLSRLVVEEAVEPKSSRPGLVVEVVVVVVEVPPRSPGPRAIRPAEAARGSRSTVAGPSPRCKSSLPPPLPSGGQGRSVGGEGLGRPPLDGGSLVVHGQGLLLPHRRCRLLLDRGCGLSTAARRRRGPSPRPPRRPPRRLSRPAP